jgi:tetratricopeptide (TPR) repeat protein
MVAPPSTRTTPSRENSHFEIRISKLTCALRGLRHEFVGVWWRLCDIRKFVVMALPILLLASSCRTAELEKQARMIREQEAELTLQRAEIEALKAGRKAEQKKLGECNRAFRDYFERAQSTADGDRAIALYRQGVALCPGDDVAHYELGKLLAAQGLDREAETEFETALKINPTFTEVKARLEALRKAR